MPKAKTEQKRKHFKNEARQGESYIRIGEDYPFISGRLIDVNEFNSKKGNGTFRVFTIDTPEGEKRVTGGIVLQQKMDKIKVGSKVAIEFEGMSGRTQLYKVSWE